MERRASVRDGPGLQLRRAEAFRWLLHGAGISCCAENLLELEFGARALGVLQNSITT